MKNLCQDNGFTMDSWNSPTCKAARPMAPMATWEAITRRNLPRKMISQSDDFLQIAAQILWENAYSLQHHSIEIYSSLISRVVYRIKKVVCKWYHVVFRNPYLSLQDFSSEDLSTWQGDKANPNNPKSININVKSSDCAVSMHFCSVSL